MGIARWCHLQATTINIFDTNISQIFQAAPINISATNISHPTINISATNIFQPSIVLLFLHIQSDCLQSYLFFSVFNINSLVLIFLWYIIWWVHSLIASERYFLLCHYMIVPKTFVRKWMFDTMFLLVKPCYLYFWRIGGLYECHHGDQLPNVFPFHVPLNIPSIRQCVLF